MPRANMQMTTHYVLNLELSPNEVDCLKAMIQNPLNGNTPETEPEIERAIRRAIFEACSRQRT